MCLAYLNRIWCSNCTVSNEFGYHSSLSCYDRYLCPWNITEFTRLALYPLTVIRKSTRRASVPTSSLTGHSTTERQWYSIAEWNSKAIPYSGAASAEYILIVYLSVLHIVTGFGVQTAR